MCPSLIDRYRLLLRVILTRLPKVTEKQRKSNSSQSAKRTTSSTMMRRDISTTHMACPRLTPAVGTVWVAGWTLTTYCSRCLEWAVACHLQASEEALVSLEGQEREKMKSRNTRLRSKSCTKARRQNSQVRRMSSAVIARAAVGRTKPSPSSALHAKERVC